MSLPLFYGQPIDTPTGHKWAGYLSPADTAARSQSMAAHPSMMARRDREVAELSRLIDGDPWDAGLDDPGQEISGWF